jgi:hypothetical protein
VDLPINTFLIAIKNRPTGLAGRAIILGRFSFIRIANLSKIGAAE